MKTVRFEFTTAREVPYYRRTLARLLQRGAQGLSLGAAIEVGDDIRYSLEASGPQQGLEQFADCLADEFPLSCFLLDARVIPVSEADRLASRHRPDLGAAAADTAPQAFCGHCFGQFGDNQSPAFGQLAWPCPHCGGEHSIGEKPSSLDELRRLATQLLDGDSISLQGQGYALQGRHLSDSLVITNPNTLAEHLCVGNDEVLALSSIEKPRLRLLPTQAQSRLTAPSYRARFARSRHELVLCELLRCRGVDWLFAIDDPALDVCAVNGRWQVVRDCQPQTLAVGSQPWKTVSALGGSSVNCRYPVLTVLPGSGQGKIEGPGLLALKGQLRGHELANVCGLYLGGRGPLEIVTLDEQGRERVFFSQRPLPANGQDILRSLIDSPQRAVLEKFKQRFPRHCLAMVELNQPSTAAHGNLTLLWALGSCILGLAEGCERPSVAYLADALIAKAQQFRGQSAPRIDYPLISGDQARAFDWSKPLGSLMSYRLAGEEDSARLAFAMMDSLADYLANWIEHLDLGIGIRRVWVSGSELTNPVLAGRLWQRLGKNLQLATAPATDLDNALFAIGDLFQRPPRRFGALGRQAADALER